MPSRTHLSDDDERAERADRDLLHRLEGRFDQLVAKRHELIVQLRQLSAEQKAIYDRRQAPQALVEQLYAEHGDLGHRLSAMRSERDKARRVVEEKIVARRELLASVGRADPPRPELIRREIAELELRQQTRALPIDEENALIARLRQRSRELREAEGHAAEILAQVERRKAADVAVAEARGAVERIVREMEATRTAREAKMAELRATLEAAGGLVAELRAKGRARADKMAEVDTIGREIATVEREGRDVFRRLRTRRDEARRTLRSFAPPRERPPAEILATAADRRFEELMKRGKVSLSG